MSGPLGALCGFGVVVAGDLLTALARRASAATASAAASASAASVTAAAPLSVAAPSAAPGGGDSLALFDDCSEVRGSEWSTAVYSTGRRSGGAAAAVCRWRGERSRD